MKKINIVKEIKDSKHPQLVVLIENVYLKSSAWLMCSIFSDSEPKYK